jgi:hypothetical protein
MKRSHIKDKGKNHECPAPSISTCPIKQAGTQTLVNVQESAWNGIFSASYDKRVSHWEGKTTYTEEGGWGLKGFYVLSRTRRVMSWC